MQMTAESFWKWAHELRVRSTDKQALENKLKIAPALLSATQYLNDERYRSADITTNSERWQNSKQNNLKFVQSKSSLPPAKFSSFRIFGI